MTLLGPLFREELNRLNRRNAVFLLRALLAGALLVAIAVEHPGDGVEIGLARQAQVARAIFVSLAAVQFVAVWFLTPLFAAAVLTEEREKKTLELLLATPLTGWDIVGGKLFARLAFVSEVLLAGLPVMAMLRVLGGIGFYELGLAYLALFANLFSIGGLAAGIAASQRSYRAALYLTWAALGVCLCVPVFNPLPGLILMEENAGPGPLAVVLFMAVNVVVGLAGLGFAVRSVRPRDADQASGLHARAGPAPSKDRPAYAGRSPGTAPPPPGLSADIDWSYPPGPAEGPNGRQLLAGAFVAAAGFVLLSGLAVFETRIPPRVWPTFMILGWVPLAIITAVQTAGVVSREQEAGTLTMLLTVPVSRTEILWRKYVAAVTRHVWLTVPWVFLAGVILLLSGELAWFPGFLAQGVGLIAAAASAGLVMTVECKTTFLAQAAAVLAVLFLAVLPGWANYAVSEKRAVAFVPVHYALLVAVAAGGWVFAAASFRGYARR
jgi:ABC-type transport system involved in multi-copper enzyme maturation permease subunit